MFLQQLTELFAGQDYRMKGQDQLLSGMKIYFVILVYY